MKRILRIIGLFCFIYGPPIATFNLIHILAGIAIIYVFISPYALGLLTDVYKKSGSLILAYAICAVVCVLNAKYQTLLNFFVVLFEIIPIAVAAVTIYKQQYSKLFDDIVWAGCLQAAISLVAFLYPPFQGVIIARMFSVGYSEVFGTMAGWRVFGLSRELTFAMPVTQSIIASICLYLAIIKDKKYFIPIPFLFFSSFINARTGMVVFALGTIVVLFSVYRWKLSSFFSLLLIGLVAFAAFSLFSSLLSRNELTSDWLMSGIEDLISFIRGEELNEKDSYFLSINDISKYKVPESFDQLLWGTGERVQGKKGLYKTDIGFINDIWTGGFVYLFLVYTFFLSKTFIIVENDTKLRKVRRSGILAYGIIIILVITNVKGQLFTWNEFIVFWFILFTIYISQNRIAKIEKNS